MDYIREKFDLIKDERHTSYVEHKLTDILIIIMCAVLSGLDQLADIVVYSREKADFFERYFDIKKYLQNLQ